MEISCEIPCKATVESASSYDYGWTIKEEVDAVVTSASFDLDVDSLERDIEFSEEAKVYDEEYEDEYTIDTSKLTFDDVCEIVSNCLLGTIDTSILLGAGWIHSTYDGTLADEDSDISTHNYELIWLDAHIDTSTERGTAMVEYIDKLVEGELFDTTYDWRVFNIEDDSELSSADDFYYDIDTCRTSAQDAVELAESEGYDAYYKIYEDTRIVLFNGDVDNVDWRVAESTEPDYSDVEFDDEY